MGETNLKAIEIEIVRDGVGGSKEWARRAERQLKEIVREGVGW